MKKLLKRIMALSLCACMMMGAAAPVSAAGIANENISVASVSVPLYGRDYIRNGNDYLNMFAASFSAVASGTNITTWDTRATDGTQHWTVYPYYENYTIRPYGKEDLSINVHRDSSYKCNLYPVMNNDAADYVVSFVDAGSGYFKVLLPNHSWYMTVITESPATESGVPHGYYVRWRQNSNDNTQTWRFA